MLVNIDPGRHRIGPARPAVSRSWRGASTDILTQHGRSNEETPPRRLSGGRPALERPPGPIRARGRRLRHAGSIKVEASADASAAGLAPAFDGGQVATGSRAGILGTRDNLETPFSMTGYTSELIKDRQARSVADVLQNDPGVRIARGFGNFQESYFIRGFILSSEDVAYNGLYGLMPRQYISSEFFERVEVLRGASNFLTGTPPTGGGVGGAINLVPKRAPNEPLTEFTTGISAGGTAQLSADIARRFGPDDSTGIRVNVGQRGGESGVERRIRPHHLGAGGPGLAQ